MADKGKAVGRYEDQVIFVDGAVPGDVVDVLVLKRKKGFLNGRTINFHTYSPDRIDPLCEHFGVCGGCKWQHLAYETQLSHKQQTVKDALERIGKIDTADMKPIMGCESTEFYRNKLEFSFSASRWITEEEAESGEPIDDRRALGFHRPRAFDKIVDVNTCHLQPDPSNAIRNAVREYSKKNDLEFFNIREQTGFLRQLFIRVSSLGEVMVILSVFHEDVEKREGLLQFLADQFPQITSLMYVINFKKNDTIFDLEIENFAGNDHIIDRLGHVQFKIGPKSFFQTNTKQAERLYEVVREMANLQGHENVYDLYTGIGSIACYVADQCASITGIEEIEAAIQDAHKNAALNEIENARFYAGDVKDILTDGFIEEHGKPDLVITDPPRAGMHKDVVQTLIQLAAPRLVYVSCNPATQARDLALLGELYAVDAIQPVDMFPHTHHIENVVALSLKA